LGTSLNEVWNSYQNQQHCFNEKSFAQSNALVAELSSDSRQLINNLRASDSNFKSLDDTTLFAVYTSRQAVKMAQWEALENFGINIGSSRGATKLFEDHHTHFLKQNKAKTLTSPSTTLGNISSWVAHDLKTRGPEISHSITCSTALHALLNGIAWINSGMSNKFLVGGSESPLTAFTVAQMRALNIYAKSNDSYPCKALDFTKKHNTMILGEGASVACLEKGKADNALAIITGIGYATEVLEHSASLSTNADCFQRSMRMALEDMSPNEVDIIITHTPGTIKGDLAEYNAIKAVFGEQYPALTTNKWKVGHTLGASGMLSIEMAVLMLKHHEYFEVPFTNHKHPDRIQYILVNAVGFGGNAVSILLKKDC
jgi:3-oxoacyl-(acyl-carrier-protein) synthase